MNSLLNKFVFTTKSPLDVIVFNFQRKLSHIQSTLRLIKPLSLKLPVKLCIYIIISLSYTSANSQETLSSSTPHTETQHLSAQEILKQAKSFRYSDKKKSETLAIQALDIASIDYNERTAAQSHSLLGKLTRDSKRIEESIQHFRQAALIYKKLNDKRNQIVSSVDYVNVLFLLKRYGEAEKTINELLPVAREFGHVLPLALTLTAKGDTFYRRKQYKQAISEYKHALKYLLGNDLKAQQQLAETYKRIAQSYKRLENREKTSYFYKKTLNVYTALDDKRLMARTLNTLAEAERYLGNYVIALEYSKRGLELHHQVNDPVGYAKALMGAGIIYRYIGRYEKSLESIHKAYTYYQKVHNVIGIAKASHQMGLIYTRLEQFELAKSFYQITIDLPKDKVEPKTLASSLREMAVIYINVNDYKSAKELAFRAYNIYKNENDKTKQSLLARVIGNAYYGQSDNARAETFYRESLSLATEVGSKLYQIKAQIPLADILIEKDINEALTLLKKSVVLSDEIKDKVQQLYAYRILHKAEASQKNFKEALSYAEKEMNLFKIIQKEKDDNELILAKANLYSHKMEMELDTLKEKLKHEQLELVKMNNEKEIAEQASKISQLELTKNKYANIALTSLLFLCCLIALFIYKRFVDSRKRNKELDYLATRDPLTNCYNRRVLLDLLNRDLSELELIGEYCIIMADIDHFKAVNDTHGHNVGDEVIHGVANILQSGVRQNDIVARFGGEEFCLVLPGAAKEQALRIAESLREKIANSHFNLVTVTCSFGVTSMQFNAKTATGLINQADLALYKSKRNGRNQVTLWDKTL